MSNHDSKNEIAKTGASGIREFKHLLDFMLPNPLRGPAGAGLFQSVMKPMACYAIDLVADHIDPGQVNEGRIKSVLESVYSDAYASLQSNELDSDMKVALSKVCLGEDAYLTLVEKAREHKRRKEPFFDFSKGLHFLNGERLFHLNVSPATREVINTVLASSSPAVRDRLVDDLLLYMTNGVNRRCEFNANLYEQIRNELYLAYHSRCPNEHHSIAVS